MGKPGYINTPSANWNTDRPLGITFSHLPGDYSMFGNEKTDVNFYSFRASLTSFFEVNLSVAHRPAKAEIDKLGVGDRQLDFRFRLSKEREFLPAIVLGWTPPGSVAPYLTHDYLLATKNFKTNLGRLQLTVGFGSPYVFLKKTGSDSYFDLEIKKKSQVNLNAEYLSGFFSAISYSPVDFAGVMMEYDSNSLNGGIYIKPFNWLSLQAHTYEAKAWGFTAGLNLSLSKSPKSLRAYEDRMD
ncbi:hypothetical protein GCM10023115_29520 [Pontixanthobacter gangjinensis]